MLARIDTLDGVTSAAVDHRGEMLRLQLRDDHALELVRETLSELGYEALEADPAEALGLRWYDAETARDLSREEAQVIADRVALPFAASHRLADPLTRRLLSAVTDALFECFASHALGSDAPAGSLRDECARAAYGAAAPLVDEAGARDLAARIEADLGVPR